MLEINIGAKVESQGREIGRVERVVLNRDSYEATHLVIKQGGLLLPRHLLMPLDWVIGFERDHLIVERSDEELAELHNFEMRHYVRLDQLDEEQARRPRSVIKPSELINYVVPLVAGALGEHSRPYSVASADSAAGADQLLSPSEMVIKRGLPVESNDGHKVGEVHDVLLSESDWRLSGLIITRGFVLKHPMRLPADWVASVRRDRLTLNRTRRQLEDWERKEV